MQSFYPPPPRRTGGLLLVTLVVLVLHGLALQQLSVAWTPQTVVAPEFEIHWSKASLLDQPPVSPAAAPLQTAKPLSKPPSIAQTRSPSASTTERSAALEALSSAPSSASPTTTTATMHAATDTSDTIASVAPPSPPSEPAPAPQTAPAAPPPASPNPSPSKAGPPWLPQAHFNWPPSLKLRYEFVGETKGIRYSADGDLLWLHNGNSYQLKQEVRHLLLGSRSQTSVGQLGPQGLLPVRFGDKFKQEVAAHFERDKGQVSFSANTPTQSLQEGAQDRLSLFVQLAALLAGSPQFQHPGQQISFQVVSGRSAEVWAFSVDKTETLKLPIGTLNTLKLSRVPLQQYDQTVEMWLSPQHGFLPARVRIAQSNGDALEQFLSQVQAP